MGDSDKGSPEWRSLGLFGIIVAEFGGLAGGGVLLGYWLNAYRGWPSWVAIVCGVLGLIIAVVRLFRWVKEIQ